MDQVSVPMKLISVLEFISDQTSCSPSLQNDVSRATLNLVCSLIFAHDCNKRVVYRKLLTVLPKFRTNLFILQFLFVVEFYGVNIAGFITSY